MFKFNVGARALAPRRLHRSLPSPPCSRMCVWGGGGPSRLAGPGTANHSRRCLTALEALDLGPGRPCLVAASSPAEDGAPGAQAVFPAQLARDGPPLYTVFPVPTAVGNTSPSAPAVPRRPRGGMSCGPGTLRGRDRPASARLRVLQPSWSRQLLRHRPAALEAHVLGPGSPHRQLITVSSPVKGRSAAPGYFRRCLAAPEARVLGPGRLYRSPSPSPRPLTVSPVDLPAMLLGRRLGIPLHHDSDDG